MFQACCLGAGSRASLAPFGSITGGSGEYTRTVRPPLSAVGCRPIIPVVLSTLDERAFHFLMIWAGPAAASMCLLHYVFILLLWRRPIPDAQSSVPSRDWILFSCSLRHKCSHPSHAVGCANIRSRASNGRAQPVPEIHNIGT